MEIASSTEYARLLHRKIARSFLEETPGRAASLDLGPDPLATRRARAEHALFTEERRGERDFVSISEQARAAYEASKRNPGDGGTEPRNGVVQVAAEDDALENFTIGESGEQDTTAKSGAVAKGGAGGKSEDQLKELRKMLEEAEKRLSEAQRKLNAATAEAEGTDPAPQAAAQNKIQAAQNEVSAAQAEVQQLSAQIMELESGGSQ